MRIDPTVHDAIVVGAGPAGCAAAFDLARGGRDVLILDRRRFPRTKACAGGLTIKTLHALRYSVAPVIREVVSELVMARHHGRSATLRAGRPVCALTVRAELDHYCLEQTVAAGARFRVIRHLDALEVGAGSVSVTVDGARLLARYVVGADGANSSVRRLLFGGRLPSLGFAMEALAAMPRPRPEMRFDFGVVADGYGWVFPKGDHVNVGVYTNGPDVPVRREDVAEYARETLPGAELDHFVGHHIGLRGWASPRARDRVFLAGDACGLVDPLLGEGIHNAIASGQAAAGAVLAGCRGDDAEAAYARAMRPVLDDIRCAARWAETFYAHPRAGFAALTLLPLGRALMRGYARGMTFSAARRRFFLPPLPRGRLRGGSPTALLDPRHADALDLERGDELLREERLQ